MEILTWNMQGYSGEADKIAILEEILNHGKYDVISIQEAGEPLTSFDLRHGLNYVEVCNMTPPEQTSDRNHIYEYTALYHEWGEGNNRCSLVTYIKTTKWDYDNTWIERSTIEGVRPMLCLRLKCGAVIGNIHLISGRETVARKQLTEFQESLKEEEFCILGDYNINALDPNNNINIKNGYFHVNKPTQLSGRCLDYYYSLNFTPEECQKVVKEGKCSDHAMISYSIRKLQ